MGTEPDQLMRLTQTISLDKAQKGIKEAMEALLLSEREVVEKEGLPSGREYRWNLRDEEYKLHKRISGEEGFIFKMIDGVRLTGDVEADDVEVDHAEVDHTELKMRKLVEMWEHMKKGDHTQLSVALTCPICP